MTLKVDKYETKNKKPVLIAPKGSEVKEISKHGNVFICEYNGKRFSVNKDDLIIDKN